MELFHPERQFYRGDGRLWDARAGSLNRMNNSQREVGVLAERIRKSIRKRSGCKIEIRAIMGSTNRLTAERLLASLLAGGLDAEIVEVAQSPQGELLIESSHANADVALALQSAFLATGTDTQLLVHDKSNPKLVVLHLGSKE